MTFRTSTLAALALFTIACAEQGPIVSDGTDERAALPQGLDGIGNSTDGDGTLAVDDAITPDDMPRLVQWLMEDIYSEGDCVPGATILGNFDDDQITGKALDTLWRTAAIIEATVDEDGYWAGEWTGVSDDEVDPNGAEVPEIETGAIEGTVDADSGTLTGTIYLADGVSMDIEGYWVHQSDISGFFFGVAIDCS